MRETVRGEEEDLEEEDKERKGYKEQRPVMCGVGQEAASVPAAPCLAWHSIKRAVLGPVKSSSWQGSHLCGDAVGLPAPGGGHKWVEGDQPES